MPAVSAIASAPHSVTRAAPRSIGAPPVRADTAPSPARKRSDPSATPHGHQRPRQHQGQQRAAAPRRRRRSRPRRARPGRARAVCTSEIPSSSRAWAPSASCAVSCARDLVGEVGLESAVDVDLRQAPRARRRARLASSPRSRSRSARSVSACELHRHVLAGRHRHGARHQAGDAGDQRCPLRRARRRHAEHQARRRDDAVVRAEDGGAQPADARHVVAFGLSHGGTPLADRHEPTPGTPRPPGPRVSPPAALRAPRARPRSPASRPPRARPPRARRRASGRAVRPSRSKTS